jgi:hypothetical protein
MKHFSTYLMYVVLLGVAAPIIRAQSSVDSVLTAVESLYSSGAYANAELEARRLKDIPILSDSVRVIAEQWIAFALVAQGRPILARDHFLEILRRRPEHELDPVFTSPKILTVFNEARVLARARRGMESDTSGLKFPAIPEPISYRTILFPGWEQLYQGRTTTGAIFLGAGVAAFGTGIAMEILRSSARNKYLSATTPAETDSRYRSYNTYYKAEMIAFVAFAIVYVVSEIDVLTFDSPISIVAASRDSSPGSSLTLAIRLP